MRRIAVTFAVTLALLVLRSGSARAYMPSGSFLHGVEHEYLALGDSLATGVGSSECPLGCAGKAGYVAEYARRLNFAAGHSVTVKDFGVNGETTDSFIADYYRNPSSQSQLARAVAEIRAHGRSISPITLDIGGNDALNVRGPGHTQEEKVAALDAVRLNLERIITTLQSELRSAGSHSDMILTAYYQPYGADDPDFWGLAWLNQIIKDAGVLHALPVAEPYATLAGKERKWTWVTCKCPIDVHPNDAGYVDLATELARVSYLPNATTGSIAGTVHDAASRPVAGATVWYGGGVMRTDANGWFRFDDVGAGVPLRINSFDPSTGAASHATAQTDIGSLTVQDLVIGATTGDAPSRPAPSGNTASGYGRIAAAVVKAGLSAAGSAANEAAAGAVSQARQASEGTKTTLQRGGSQTANALGAFIRSLH